MHTILSKHSFGMLILTTLLAFSSNALAFAQTPTPTATPIPTLLPGQQQCLALINSLQTAITDCDDINSNWACYGNLEADVVPVQYRFHGLRDRRPLTVLEELNTNTNGVVLMNLQIEGETNPIKTIMFGDGRLEAAEPGQHSFFMQIDDPAELCTLTPPGMIIQTETGQSGELTLNQVTIELASTAFVTFEADGLMTVANLGGQVTVIIDGVRQPLLEGEQVRVAFVNGQPQFAGPPSASRFFGSIVLTFLAGTDGITQIHNSNQTDAACVQELQFGETITAQNIAPGHECLYKFCAVAGDVITVNMDAASTALNPWVDLRGPDDLLLAYNNDVDMAAQDSLLCNVGLAETSCDYTIVARSHHNESFGAFTLTLAKQTSCVQPEPRCDVMTYRGLNLRTGPGTQFTRVDTLVQGTSVEPIRRSEDSNWVFVNVQEPDLTGWVRNSPELFECEFVEPRVSIVEVLPTEVSIPTATPAPNATPMPDGTVVAASCDGLIAPPNCPDSRTPLPTGDKQPTPTPKTPEPVPTVCQQKCDPFGAP
jgi:hypothetical protein